MAIELSYLNQQKKWNNEEDIQHVVDDLNKNVNNIKTLHLTGNTMGVKAAQLLAKVLPKQKNIDRLLWSDIFTGRMKDEIAISLKTLSMGLIRAQVNLVELDLSDNAFGPNGVVGVTDLIANPCCYTLKVLNMNNQGLGHEGCRALVCAMKKARANSEQHGLNLEVFIAGRNRLENVGMEMLSEVFGDGMCSLKKLVLLQNGIGLHGIDGIISLVVAIRNHKNLRVLNIADNNIKSNGMNLLSDVLPDFDNLEEIYMDDCLLKNRGTKIFSLVAEDKTICPALKVISLMGNEMKSAVAVTLISAIIEGKPTIEKVDLRENEITRDGMCEIQRLLTNVGRDDLLVEDEEIIDEEDDNYENDGSSDDDESSEENSDDDRCSDTASDNIKCKEDNDIQQSYDSVDEFSKIPSDVPNFKCDPFDTSLFDNNNECKNMFGSKNSNSPNVFGNVSKSSNSVSCVPHGLFAASITAPNPFRYKDSGVFTPSLLNSSVTTSAGLFTMPSTKSNTPSTISSGLFSDSNKIIPSGLFSSLSLKSTISSPASGGLFSSGNPVTSNGGLFSTQSDNKNPFGSKVVFDSTSNSARTDLFSIPTSKVNIFASDPVTLSRSVKPFSFFEAAKLDDSSISLKDSIKTCLKSDLLMTINKVKLNITNQSPSNIALDSEMKKLAEIQPENGVRVGLILCEEINTFELGISLLTHLLTSASKWSQSTNAILVEMNCIKSEEKHFVPIGSVNPLLPINVLQKILLGQLLSDQVKNNLSIVLKNLTKTRTTHSEDLLSQLDQSMHKLSI